MRKTESIILSMIFLFILLSTQLSYSGNQVKTIVIFLPFSPNLPAYQNFLEGFRGTLSEGTDEPVNLLIEYLDVGRTADEEYVKHIVELYNEKLKDYKIDLLITSAPFTYSLLKKYKLAALEKVPTIKIELDPPIEKPSSRFLNSNTIEIKLKIRITETFNHAFELFPHNKDVFIISGNSGTDQYFTALIQKGIQDLRATHQFNFITGIAFDSVIQKARNIPSNSIIFIPTYLSDKKNIPFSTPEAIRLISSNCNAPVFPIFDSFLKTKGGIGGYIFSYIFLGKETGRIARGILDGKNSGSIKVNNNMFYQYMYDWEQLKQWNLSGSKAIPSNSIFYNKDPDFIQQYKWHILFILFILISETILIAYLIKLNRKQKDIVKQKIETENLFLQLIREDRLTTMVELTASLSHELNQPLTAILYSAQAGKLFLEPDKFDIAQAKEIFDNIIEDDKRAAGLISSVRSLMKLESRENEKVNLNELIQDTTNIFQAEAIRQKIKINQKLHNELVFVFGDKIQLQQVILNFMSNAVIAMENSALENKTIEIRQFPNKKSVSVSVRDSGPGIDSMVKDKIFKPFVTTRKSGFGIGLAVCRSIIEKHNGQIMAENIAGGGAEFSFILPVINDE